MSSIREVARLAGVSPSTVSRVMNNTANVDNEKKQRVLKAIEETGFIPNELARSLYKKSSKIIGMIVPTIENPFFSEMAKAVEDAAYKEGYRFTLCNSNNDYEKEIANIKVMTQMNADGMILMTNDERVRREVNQFKLPVIVMDRQIKETPVLAYIHSDHYKGGRLAAQHLIDCGCKDIVYMRASQIVSSGRQRFRGFQDVCLEHDLPVQYVDCNYNYDDGIEAIQRLLAEYPKVDGILASNDMVAIAAHKILKQKGYRIPEDVQLIGYDNINLSWQITPELTTIAQSTKTMGALAVQILINHVKGNTSKLDNIFDVELIQRETTRKRG